MSKAVGASRVLLAAGLSRQPGRPSLLATHLPARPEARGRPPRKPELGVATGRTGSRCPSSGTAGRGRWRGGSRGVAPARAALAIPPRCRQLSGRPGGLGFAPRRRCWCAWSALGALRQARWGSLDGGEGRGKSAAVGVVKAAGVHPLLSQSRTLGSQR